MSKHITKIKKGAPRITGKAPKQGNQRRIGERTAKRMTERARPKDFDEEIDSDLAEDIDAPET